MSPPASTKSLAGKSVGNLCLVAKSMTSRMRDGMGPTGTTQSAPNRSSAILARVGSMSSGRWNLDRNQRQPQLPGFKLQPFSVPDVPEAWKRRVPEDRDPGQLRHRLLQHFEVLRCREWRYCRSRDVAARTGEAGDEPRFHGIDAKDHDNGNGRGCLRGRQGFLVQEG